MHKTRETYPVALKAQVAVEAIKAHKSTSEIAEMFGVHPKFVNSWKKLALDLLPQLFALQAAPTRFAIVAEKEELFRQIGALRVEMDLLKTAIGELDGGSPLMYGPHPAEMQTASD